MLPRRGRALTRWVKRTKFPWSLWSNHSYSNPKVVAGRLQDERLYQKISSTMTVNLEKGGGGGGGRDWNRLRGEITILPIKRVVMGRGGKVLNKVQLSRQSRNHELEYPNRDHLDRNRGLLSELTRRFLRPKQPRGPKRLSRKSICWVFCTFNKDYHHFKLVPLL